MRESWGDHFQTAVQIADYPWSIRFPKNSWQRVIGYLHTYRTMYTLHIFLFLRERERGWNLQPLMFGGENSTYFYKYSEYFWSKNEIIWLDVGKTRRSPISGGAPRWWADHRAPPPQSRKASWSCLVYHVSWFLRENRFKPGCNI